MIELYLITLMLHIVLGILFLGLLIYIAFIAFLPLVTLVAVGVLIVYLSKLQKKLEG